MPIPLHTYMHTYTYTHAHTETHMHTHTPKHTHIKTNKTTSYTWSRSVFLIKEMVETGSKGRQTLYHALEQWLSTPGS